MQRTRRGLPLVAVLVGLLSVAASCDQCQQLEPPRRGNLDRVSDAVLVTADDGHSYVVTANPELQNLRVLDLTTERFVDAPNLFFPLSIPVGPATYWVAAAPDVGTRVFALDAALGQVFVIRTVEEGFDAFSTVGEPVPVGIAPAGLAAYKADDHFELWVTLPDEGAVKCVEIAFDTAAIIDQKTVQLAEDARPDAIAVDPLGTSVVVTDAALGVVHVISRTDPTRETRVVDIGGPSGDVDIGVVDVGDGLAPVALVLARDAPAAYALRLFREGFREPAVALLGGTELPSFPMVSFVPDQRPDDVDPTVCCRGLSDESVDAGEATAAWAAVGMANGQVVYLALDDGVRLIDDDADPVSGAVDLNADPVLWAPAPGSIACSQGCGGGFVCDANSDTCVVDLRPVNVTVSPIDNFGDPPFVDLVAAGETLLATWEGSPPGLANLRGALTLSGAGAIFDPTVDLADRDVRLGDFGLITSSDFSAECAERTIRAEIVDVTDDVVTLEGLSPEDLDCLRQSGDKRLSVEAREAFVVVTGARDYLGRLSLLAGDPEGSVEIPGAIITMDANPNGLPERGSRLAIPLDPHVTTLGLNLAAPRQRENGGFSQAGLLPTAILGDVVSFPNVERTGLQTARRMVITTASEEGGLNELFVCDEAETVAALCTEFR